MRWVSLPRGARLIALAACLGLVAGVAVRNLAYYPLRVTSNSMFPSIAKGDWVVISPQQAATKAAVHRGDIVLFRFPFGGGGRAIKRVVAIAGDQVKADRDEVRVNGESAAYGSKIPIPRVVTADSASQAIVVPEGYFYILGDNVASSVDSRSLGLLPQTEVLGKVSAVIKKPW
jgi:signal peptidase I